jgi:hypothetical protein
MRPDSATTACRKGSFWDSFQVTMGDSSSRSRASMSSLRRVARVAGFSTRFLKMVRRKMAVVSLPARTLEMVQALTLLQVH